MSALEKLVELLRKQAWRDKILRTVTYACSLVAARWPGTKLAVKLSSFAAAVGNTRAYTRLLDDLPMLKSTLEYGLGGKNESTLHRVLQVMENISYQLFFPAEHMKLFCQLGIFSNADSQKWAGRATKLWGLGLFFVISKNLLKYRALNRTMYNLIKTEQSDEAKAAIEEQKLTTSLILSKDVCDFMNAIHWYPGEFLWSGKLTPTQSAMFGMASTVVGIHLLSRK